MSKHTFGPWTIAMGADGSTLVTSTHDKDGIDDDVCLVYGGNDSDPKTMSANARLIAKAPELLAAACRLLDYFDNADDHPDCIKDDVLIRLREVVEAATNPIAWKKEES